MSLSNPVTCSGLTPPPGVLADPSAGRRYDFGQGHPKTVRLNQPSNPVKTQQPASAGLGPMQTDEELVTLAMGGDSESFNQLVLRWERPIHALAYRTLGREDEARDVC